MALSDSYRHQFRSLIKSALGFESKTNQVKPTRYWYPLSLASYDSDEIIEALDSMCSFRTSMWEKTLEFERRFSTYQGCFDSVMVNSGSSADLLMMFLLSNPRNKMLDSGDEVLMPIVTWPTQVWSAMMAGFKVKFVDCDPETLNIDLDDLERKISSKTKAIFLVHLLGNPCNMDRILELSERNGILILEDCCEAMGAEFGGKKVGNFGLAASFSMFFSHHITTMEGGMIACNKPEIVDELKVLRAHGWTRNISRGMFDTSSYNIDPRYSFVNWGFNVRPTDINAAFGLEQLRKLPSFNSRRTDVYERFVRQIASFDTPIKFPKVHPKSLPSWLSIPMVLGDTCSGSRDSFCQYLELNGVETRPIVAGNLSRHPVANLFSEFKDGEFPGADIIHNQGLYIGLSPMVTDESIDRLLELISLFKWF